MPRVLAILAEGFEEIEVVTPVDLLRRAGAEVTLAALTEDLRVTGRCGLVLQADTALARVANETFDCLFLPGGPGVRYLRADKRVLDLIRAQHAAHRWIAAICAAPTVLLDAGVLHARRRTAHFSVAAELPDLLSHERVVVDGHIITSRGAGTALDFGLAIVERLFSSEKAAEISRSICA
jgi:4-methyl-5(b-hydroxyethyl)-thiazole monophosphate biosynthesis